MKLKLISDGTNAGTKLIDEDSGEMIHLIQKLTWEVNSKDSMTKVTVELINIPVEIVSKAQVELLDYNKESWSLETSKTFEKEIKVVSQQKCLGLPLYTTVTDTQTSQQVGAIQEVKWEANLEEIKATVKRIKFDNKDW